ncbi:MAG TPA: PRC-barrel domain-containing protein [Candidatus Polarisedimenticolia bacterium]|jgi:sporulation protein YlmC with PRC-barrel domain|nr:PRC-barrel domain-containing protein [Candidatus Polarisedimenticolia bacterium]
MQNKSLKSTVVSPVVSASKIIGEAVINQQKENLGKVHELVIDTELGAVAYVVLSFGGFLGMGNKLFAIPWQAFEFSAIEYKLILNVNKEKLKNAPGFDPEKVPNFADRSWGETVHNYYGYRAAWNN